MNKPVASAKPNRPFIFIGNRRVAYYYIVKKEWKDGDRLMPLIKRRYKKTIQLLRDNIDTTLKEMSIEIPVYKDEHVTDILLCIKKTKLEERKHLAESISVIIKS